MAHSSPVQGTQELALRAFLVWAGQGSSLRPWDKRGLSEHPAERGILSDKKTKIGRFAFFFIGP
jgi:hypothetical protein